MVTKPAYPILSSQRAAVQPIQIEDCLDETWSQSVATVPPLKVFQFSLFFSMSSLL